MIFVTVVYFSQYFSHFSDIFYTCYFHFICIFRYVFHFFYYVYLDTYGQFLYLILFWLSYRFKTDFTFFLFYFPLFSDHTLRDKTNEVIIKGPTDQDKKELPTRVYLQGGWRVWVLISPSISLSSKSSWTLTSSLSSWLDQPIPNCPQACSSSLGGFPRSTSANHFPK